MPQDWAEAVRLHRLAADQNHAEARYDVAKCLADGKGVSRDWAEAMRLYRLSADQGFSPACLGLGAILVCACAGDNPSQLREGVLFLARAAQHREDTEISDAALALLGEHANERMVVRACCIGCGKSKGLMGVQQVPRGQILRLSLIHI